MSLLAAYKSREYIKRRRPRFNLDLYKENAIDEMKLLWRIIPLKLLRLGKSFI